MDDELNDLHDERHDDEALAPQNIVDPVIFGRRLRALRIIRGYDRVRDLVCEMRRHAGVVISERTVYAIERGEQPPTLDFFMAVMYVLRPEGGARYFMESVRLDIREAMEGQL